ncbi:hypothetical protein LTR50_003265 [Elasticomyces elasticus]|nr:hypothetical protein LTR50_003265 [Elasticomyces elasticus]
MAHLADALKEKGNAYFKSGDFAAAEEQYGLAIQKYTRNPLLFTNRANARLKLQKWEGVVDDCLKSIELTGHGQNFKAYFQLAQAQLALHHPHEALSSALTAYDHVLHPTPSNVAKSASSIMPISNLVLKCRKAKFAARERERLRRRGDVLAELEDALDRNKRARLDDIEARLSRTEIGVIQADDERQETLNDFEKKVGELRSVFALADPQNHAPREIPDHLIDTITFEPMHDPVVTKNGHSYERATLMEHLKLSPTDPLTREPLTVNELRPNLGLRAACEEFWESAGSWAGDW